MIDDLVKEIDELKKEINLLKQSTKFVMDKLEKSIGDRVAQVYSIITLKILRKKKN